MERRQSSVVETALEVRDHVLERLSAVPVQAETLRESRPSKVSTENLEIGFESGRINSIQGFQSISTMKSSRYIHEDGIRRSGNTLTACGHIITAVIGAGVLAMPYAMASLGWILGAFCFVIFAAITLYTSQLLADLYIIDGIRMRTFTQMVNHTMGYTGMVFLGIVQQANLVLTTLAYTITAAQSMKALAVSSCGGSPGCFDQQWAMAIIFGAVQIFLSQGPNLEHFWLSSLIGAVMSFGYCIIAFGLTVGYANTLGGIEPMQMGTKASTVWNILNAIGTILFAYSFSFILLEIQDTMHDVPGTVTGPISSMKKAVNISVGLMTGFYIAVGCAGFASLGYSITGSILEDYEGIAPSWVLDMANVMVIVHMVPAYQVWAQPHYEFAEGWMATKFKDSFLPKTLQSGFGLRLLYRTIYVCLMTFLACLLPYFTVILGFVGAIGFWPATVYFPINCWIMVFKPGRKLKWAMRILDVFCLLVTLAAIAGSIEQMIDQAKSIKLFGS